jgi:hypothetical protein
MAMTRRRRSLVPHDRDRAAACRTTTRGLLATATYHKWRVVSRGANHGGVRERVGTPIARLNALRGPGDRGGEFNRLCESRIGSVTSQLDQVAPDTLAPWHYCGEAITDLSGGQPPLSMGAPNASAPPTGAAWST